MVAPFMAEVLVSRRALRIVFAEDFAANILNDAVFRNTPAAVRTAFFASPLVVTRTFSVPGANAPATVEPGRILLIRVTGLNVTAAWQPWVVIGTGHTPEPRTATPNNVPPGQIQNRNIANTAWETSWHGAVASNDPITRYTSNNAQNGTFSYIILTEGVA
jgi:hypothetical protein